MPTRQGGGEAADIAGLAAWRPLLGEGLLVVALVRTVAYLGLEARSVEVQDCRTRR